MILREDDMVINLSTNNQMVMAQNSNIEGKPMTILLGILCMSNGEEHMRISTDGSTVIAIIIKTQNSKAILEQVTIHILISIIRNKRSILIRSIKKENNKEINGIKEMLLIRTIKALKMLIKLLLNCFGVLWVSLLSLF